jgi:hypothetical protein
MRFVKQRAILPSLGRVMHSASATETAASGLLHWLATQADEAAATINLPRQSRCERRL